MNIRQVSLHDCDNTSVLKWMFEGTVIEAEKDLRDFVKSQGIENWFGTISAMQGQLVVRK